MFTQFFGQCQIEDTIYSISASSYDEAEMFYNEWYSILIVPHNFTSVNTCE